MIKKLFAKWLRYRIYKAFPGGFGANIDHAKTDQQNHLSREGNILDGPAPRSRE